MIDNPYAPQEISKEQVEYLNLQRQPRLRTPYEEMLIKDYLNKKEDNK